MNFLQNKLRSRLGLDVIDKLLFIYINSRSLRAYRGEKEWERKDFKELFHELLLNMEDDIVQLEELVLIDNIKE